MARSIHRDLAGGDFAVRPQITAEIVRLINVHYPELSPAAHEAAGKLLSAMLAAVGKVSRGRKQDVFKNDGEMMGLIEDAVAAVSPAHFRPEVDQSRREIVDQGTELGELLEEKEGLRRLEAYATPSRIEDWAGPVAGPQEIQAKFGTPRSTLHAWKENGAVIGLLKGQRKHVYALAQFVDGRPVEGMAEGTKVIPNARVAWQWLIRSKPSIGGSPLDRLRNGDIQVVVEAAERDFGR